MKKINFFVVAATIFLIAAGCNADPAPPTQSDEPSTISEVVAPISRASERITIKPFGLQVSPGNSPVSPEKFTGFHSGTDFEAFPDEANSDVAINVICRGKIASKRTAQGYGGVVTQHCNIDGQDITVIYGHMRISSVTANVGDEFKAGDYLGVLGTGYSVETDNERKHLHLGIVKGHGTDIRGYVPEEAGLSNYLDITKYL